MNRTQDMHLVEQAQAGDAQAFGQLVQEHQRTVYGVAFSTVGNWSAAEDIAQETFLLAWSRRDSLRNARAFPAWIRHIAANLARNWLRSKEYRRRLAQRYRAAADPSLSHEACLDGESRRAEVWRALQGLPDDLRTIIVLYYLHEQSVSEVATALDISENAARKRLQRARAKLRAHFEEQWNAEMARAGQSTEFRSAKDRFLAGLALGPAVPEIGKRATSTGLGLAFNAALHGKAAHTLGVVASMILVGATVTWYVILPSPSPTPSPQVSQPPINAEAEAATAPTTEPTPTAPSRSIARLGQISGKVVERSTGKSIPSASVELRRGDSPITALTDAAGDFAFSDVDSGSYHLQCIPPETMNLYWPNTEGNGIALSLSPGEDIDGLHLELESGVALAGLVINENEEPIADAQIIARFSKGVVAIAEKVAITNVQGRFALTGAPPLSSGYAHVKAPGYVDQAADLKIVPAFEPPETTIVMYAECSISGIVVLEGGTPVANLNLLARGKLGANQDSAPTIVGGGVFKHNEQHMASAKSDEDGYFRFAGLKPLTYVIDSQPDEEFLQVHGLGVRTEIVPVDLSDVGHVEDVKIEVEHFTPSLITGRVLDESRKGLEGASVSATNGLLLNFTGTSGRDGAFSLLLNMPLDDPQAEAPSRSFSISASRDGYSTATVNPVTPEAADILLTLESIAPLHGRVLSATTRKPLHQFRVTLEARIGNRAEFTNYPPKDFISSDGTFTLPIHHLDAENLFRIEAPGFARTLAPADSEQLRGVKEFVVLLEEDMSVNVRILAADTKRPIAMARVLFANLARSDTNTSYDYLSDEEGEVLLQGVKEGPVTLAVFHEDFLPIEQTINILPGSTDAVKVMLHPGARIEGIVYYQGQGAAGVQVNVFDETEDPPKKLRVVTDSEGRYSISPLTTGHYTVNALHPTVNKAMAKGEIDVREGQLTVFDIELPAGQLPTPPN